MDKSLTQSRPSTRTDNKRKGKILITEGLHDPGIASILQATKSLHVEVISILIGENCHPSLICDLNANTLSINGKQIQATALFMRRNVFFRQHRCR
ncbi:hypothetical protein [Nitrosomonas marina]|uniref:Uncharacterized protein n=1 Tax=Nitrosomonas marina TaxID=917 RepID=A0A1H8AC49_9PROT|nr:hypothetical protein [Nitrosomonas marina]SEM68442.1 hypothetical protein SAMN05216325_10180 [Nitrosomonas marina]